LTEFKQQPVDEAQPLLSESHRGPCGALPRVGSVLAVCAHPDDESFGLGSALGAFADRRAEVAVLCFTHGEASTLGVAHGDLKRLRDVELRAAAQVLSVGRVTLLDYPDGGLAEQPIEALAADVQPQVRAIRPDLLLVFDREGIAGHPHHRRATQAAFAAAEAADLPVLGWVIAERAARTLNTELQVSFVLGRRAEDIDVVVHLDRARQREAIACHRSQSVDSPVLRRVSNSREPWKRFAGSGAASLREAGGRARIPAATDTFQTRITLSTQLVLSAAQP
jgi:LmbE family N-acetylglucosaminyl deacetylase